MTASIGLKDAMQGDHVVIDAFGRIIEIAPNVTATLGFAPGRLLGRNMVHRMAATSRAAFESALSAARTSGTFPKIACDLRRAVGAPLPATLGVRHCVGRGDRVLLALWVCIPPEGSAT